ncbi:F-box only protein 33 isoform 2-T2 [Pholidichthys leucotaenia]
MALCGGVGAMALPSELIVHIFSFLSDRDKLRASAVCARWRECLFYPMLWTELKLRVGGRGSAAGTDEAARLEFLVRKFGSFVRELHLDFTALEVSLSPDQPNAADPESDPRVLERWREAMGHYLDRVMCVFAGIRNNRNLQKLTLYGDTFSILNDGPGIAHVHLVYQGQKKLNDIQQLFMEVLCSSRQLRWLSSSFMLGLVTDASLASLSNPSTATLQHLSLLDHHLETLISPSELDRLSNLRSLALDFSEFTSELCSVLASRGRTPLLRLSLLLRGAALEFKSLQDPATEDNWKALVRASTNLRVYIMALEVDSSELLQVLKPSIPLERLHFDSYSSLLTDATLDLISQQYNRTLTHVLLVRESSDFPDLSVNRNEDPLVLLAWRCRLLTVLVIHGASLTLPCH